MKKNKIPIPVDSFPLPFPFPFEPNNSHSRGIPMGPMGIPIGFSPLVRYITDCAIIMFAFSGAR